MVSEVLRALDVPEDWLPRVLEGPDRSGEVRAELADELGLAARIRSRPEAATTPRRRSGRR